ncbi:uncharacterized protein LOC131956187 [Physella acuta]|uniref:uncharacterized protein LOC131956187 n=1 Tax=Physella acuta TaxID=109671 RepID=UPI0027DE9831|nr:uncharacterized protein LOC131956187 [Physella acuta]
MASKESLSKYFTGTHEVQECLEGQGEIDLQTHLANCKKNPGHEEFLPVNYLCFGYQDNDLNGFTKALADLTVMIAVQFTSPDRPEFVPGTKDPYPCCNTRGQNSLRTGTGRVLRVTESTKGMEDYRSCPCPEYEHSDTPSKVWCKVEVLTSRHVIFDSSEARQSNCRLWFDDDESPVVNIYGWDVCEADTQQDLCLLYCVTHVIGVAGQLEEMVGRFYTINKKVNEKYKSRRDVERLTIIVSHPHGCSKQVSVGHWLHKQGEGRQTRYTYTTSTCPGSSGALVYRLGHWMFNHLHIGTNSSITFDGLNYSCLHWEQNM